MGLFLRMGVGANAGPQVGTVGSQSPGSTTPSGGGGTIAQQAFGPAYTPTGKPSLWAALFPNDAFGVTFWTGVAAVIGLALIRHALPE